MKRNFYNADLDIQINFTGDEFVIIGDQNLVSDETLAALHTGRAVPGWKRAPRVGASWPPCGRIGETLGYTIDIKTLLAAAN